MTVPHSPFASMALRNLLLVAVACTACSTNSGGQDAAPNCTYIDATACNMPTPSFANDIAPILNKACNETCHAPGVGPWPLADWQDVSDWASIIDNDIQHCSMPPADAGVGNAPLTDAQRAQILNWIVCGAPNN